MLRTLYRAHYTDRSIGAWWSWAQLMDLELTLDPDEVAYVELSCCE